MARAINPLLSTDASGTFAGLQYARTRSGPSVRSVCRGSQRQTKPRLEARAAVAKAVRIWQTWPDETRASWRAAAPFTGLGFGLWISRSVPFLRLNLDPPQQPLPLYDAPPPRFWLGDPPQPPLWTVTVHIELPPREDLLTTLAVATVSRGARPPHSRQYTIQSYAITDITELQWSPGYDFGAAYLSIVSRWTRTGQIVATDLIYVET